MSTITTTPEPVDVDQAVREQLVRHMGLYARDLYELNGDTGPHRITGNDTLVMWNPEKDAAVFHLAGVTLTVPSSALDAVALVPASAQIQRPGKDH